MHVRIAVLMCILVASACGTGRFGTVLRVMEVPEDTHDWAPAWSPDGSRIAFNAGAGAEGHIYVMNADGTGRTRLTFAEGEHERPRWSPDGRRIAFNSSRNGNADIYLMNADGTGQTAITSHPADDARADWSPDGSRIVFDSERDGNREIYVMNADGSALTRLTMHGATDGYPSWAPDGTRIVFNSDRDGDGEIYVMNADGSNVRQLTHNDGALDQAARWSPDGMKITFFSNRDNQSPFRINESEIYVMNADGTNQTRLTTARGWDFMPSWSPDGRFIVFDSQRDGRRALYVMTANGFAQTKISNVQVSDFIVMARRDGIGSAVAAYEGVARGPDGSRAPPFLPDEAEAMTFDLLNGRRIDEALTLARFAASAFPDYTDAWVTLAELELEVGDKVAAVRAWESALALTPADSALAALLRAARAD